MACPPVGTGGVDGSARCRWAPPDESVGVPKTPDPAPREGSSHDPRSPVRPARTTSRWLGGAVAAPVVTTLTAATVSAPTTLGHPEKAARPLTGTLQGGAACEIRMPEHWNGTLAVNSQRLVPPGEDNPAAVAPDPAVGKALLDRGVALAGSSLTSAGMGATPSLNHASPRAFTGYAPIRSARAGDVSGRAFFNGTVRCSNPGFVDISIFISQRVGARVARGTGGYGAECGRTRQSWGDHHRFGYRRCIPTRSASIVVAVQPHVGDELAACRTVTGRRTRPSSDSIAWRSAPIPFGRREPSPGARGAPRNHLAVADELDAARPGCGRLQTS